MSQITRAEVLVQKRMRYARPGKEHKGKIIDELVDLVRLPLQDGDPSFAATAPGQSVCAWSFQGIYQARLVVER